MTASPVAATAELSGPTVHTNPGWKDEMQANFRALIVSKCSEATKSAFDDNEDIQVDLLNLKLPN